MVDIAISFASSFVSKVAEYLVPPIGRQIGYIWNYNSNFDNLKEEIEKLEHKRGTVQHDVDTARRNGEKIELPVNVWLDNVIEMIDEASTVVGEKEQGNTKCFKGLCPSPKKRWQFGRKAAKKAEAVAKLCRDGSFTKVSYKIIPKEIWIPSHKGYEAFKSRETTLKEIRNALLDPNINMIGVHGSGGIGKTTLVRKVAEYAENDNLFNVVAFTEVKEKPDIKEIQQEIADRLGLKFDEEKSLSGRARRLHARLKDEEKVLLVLDNIWERLSLEEVGIPFDDDHRGCKLLLTARDLSALTLTGSEHNFSMGFLEDQEAWTLFSTTVGDSVEQSDELQNLAKDVAKACGGLPIAIVTIAKALKNKGAFEWRNALHQLKNPSSSTLEGVAGKTCSCIEFSYNQLNGEELRTIFLLCCVMKSTYDASVRELVIYIWGLGVFKSADRIEKVRDQVRTLVRRLKDASLLLDTPDNESFSMHDVVRDVGRLIASRNQHVVKVMNDNIGSDWYDDDALKTSTRIFLNNVIELSEELTCPNLQLLYIKGTNALKIPDNFFTRMSKIRVLHLFGFDLSSLPTSLCQLEDLRTLCMDKCKVKDMALIGKLKKLESLSIDDYGIERLPEEICELTRLRFLDVQGCSNLEVIPPNVISRLTQLEELYLGNRSIQWEDLKGNNVLTKGLFSKMLERYDINIGGTIMKHSSLFLRLLLEKKSRNLESRKLKLSCFTDVHHKMQSVKKVVSILDGGDGFPNLKQLFVEDSSFFHTVADCSELNSCDPFPSLETLLLDKLNNLETIYNGQLGSKNLCHLVSIKVFHCAKLKNIFSFSTSRALPLQEIDVYDCANMKEIFAIGREEDIIQLKELCSMTLTSLPQLTSFCSINNNEVIEEDKHDIPTPFFNVTVTFTNSETSKLGAVNSQQIWHNQLPTMPTNFQSLRELKIQNCPKIKYLFSSSMVVFPKLEMIVISCMDNLEMIWDNQLTTGSFSSLKSVEVKLSSKLLTIFQFNMFARFPRLESLTVSSCDSLEEIFDLQRINFEELSGSTISSQLRKMDIKCLPQMRHVWNEDPKGMLSFRELNEVKISQCRSLKNLFPTSIAKELLQLEQLTISECGQLVEIVAKERVDIEEVTGFDFPRLTSLILFDLPQLRHFYPGIANWPALNKLRMSDCQEIGSLASQETNEEGQSNIPAFFVVKKGYFLNLEEVYLGGENFRLISQAHFSEHLIPKLKFLEVSDDKSAVFPPDILWRFLNLEKLQLEDSSYEEVFSLEGVEKHGEKIAQVKSLELEQLGRLKHIWKQHSKLDFILQKLEILKVSYCGLADLMPSSASFQSLKILCVQYCHDLTNIFTSSTAKSLEQLTEMEISSCNKLTKVVARDEGDITEYKIIFRKLKSLKLIDLSSLRNFCIEEYGFEFPSLESLRVFSCSKMESFSPGCLSTPKLNRVRGRDSIWEGDIDTLIQQMYKEQSFRIEVYMYSKYSSTASQIK